MRLAVGDDGSVGDQGEVDPGVGDQVRLELVQVDVQSAFEPRVDTRYFPILANPLSWCMLESFYKKIVLTGKSIEMLLDIPGPPANRQLHAVQYGIVPYKMTFSQNYLLRNQT